MNYSILLTNVKQHVYATISAVMFPTLIPALKFTNMDQPYFLKENSPTSNDNYTSARFTTPTFFNRFHLGWYVINETHILGQNGEVYWGLDKIKTINIFYQHILVSTKLLASINGFLLQPLQHFLLTKITTSAFLIERRIPQTIVGVHNFLRNQEFSSKLASSV